MVVYMYKISKWNDSVIEGFELVVSKGQQLPISHVSIPRITQCRLRNAQQGPRPRTPDSSAGANPLRLEPIRCDLVVIAATAMT